MFMQKPCSHRAFFLRYPLPKFERMALFRHISYVMLLLACCGRQDAAHAQGATDQLQEAQAWQLRGKPEQAIRILEPLIPQLQDPASRWKAQRQFAIALATSGSDSAAILQTRRLLMMNPWYRADALNDPPAFVRALQQFRAEPATSLLLRAGIGMGSASAYRIFNPAAYTKTYSATAAYSVAAGLSHHLRKNLVVESALAYERSGFDYVFGLADWSSIEVRERSDLLALPLALRLGSAEYRGQSWFFRAGLTPALALDVRNDYVRTFDGQTRAYNVLSGSRSLERRNAFQLALHSGIGWQRSTPKGVVGLQLAANYWQTPWVKESARFAAPDITYAYFLYDDDLRRMDLSLQVFAGRNIRWRTRQQHGGPGISKPWELWLQAPSALAGSEADNQLNKANNWLARGAFSTLTDSIPRWIHPKHPQGAALWRAHLLAQYALGDSLGVANAIEKLLTADPHYLRFPGADPLPLQLRLKQYRILQRFEIGLQAGILMPTLHIVAYHNVAGTGHTFRSIPGYTAGLLAGHQFHPHLRLQGGLQLFGFGYSANSTDLNAWQQEYRENLQYVGVPLRLLLHVPGKNYGLSLGGQAAWLTRANSETVLRAPDGGISRNTLNNFPDRTPFQWSWATGIFCRIAAGDAYFQLDGSWTQSRDLFNNPDQRFRRPAYRLDYGYIDSDIRFGTLQLQCAFILPLSFHPKYIPAK